MAIPDVWNVLGRAPEGHTVDFLLSWTSEFLIMQLHRIPVLLFL